MEEENGDWSKQLLVGLVHKLFTEFSNLNKTDYDGQIEVLNKLIKLDPSNSEWPYLLYNTRKFQRRSSHDSVGFSLPSKEEIIAIGKATDLDPDNPKIILARCSAMLDFVKYHGVWWTGSVCFGKGHFFFSASGDGGILESVRVEARRALELDPKSDVTNIGVFEIFATNLPPTWRAPDFAKECLDNALAYNPNSSRAHARVGSFYYQQLVTTAPEALAFNLEVVEDHYLRAIQIEKQGDKPSTSALTDLLKIYLAANPLSFGDLLEENIRDPVWNETQKSKLYFMKGLAHFAREENSDGFEAWFTSYELDKSVVEKARFLDRDAHRYRWPAETLKAENIFIILGQLKRSGKLSPEQSRAIVKFRENLGKQLSVPATSEGKPHFKGNHRQFPRV